jgi:hypothetical protein
MQKQPRHSRFAILRRSEPVIVGYATLSLIGALSLSYYCLRDIEHAGTSVPAPEAPVYDARAVPMNEGQDHGTKPLQTILGATSLGSPEVPADDEEQAAPGSVSHASHLSHPSHLSPVETAALQRADLPLYSFPELDAARAAANIGSVAALAGTAAAQLNSSGMYAPDAEFGAVAPVPEPSEWGLVGVAALLLCVGERLRARRRQMAAVKLTLS